MRSSKIIMWKNAIDMISKTELFYINCQVDQAMHMIRSDIKWWVLSKAIPHLFFITNWLVFTDDNTFKLILLAYHEFLSNLLHRRSEENRLSLRNLTAFEVLECDLSQVYKYFPTWIQGTFHFHNLQYPRNRGELQLLHFHNLQHPRNRGELQLYLSVQFALEL